MADSLAPPHLIDDLTTILNAAGYTPEDAAEVLIYVLGDVMSAGSEGVYCERTLGIAYDLLQLAYKHHCSYEAANITNH